MIEIELKGKEGHSNVVIRREMFLDTSASNWFINGIFLRVY